MNENNQEQKKGIVAKIRDFGKNAMRVLRVSSKPSGEEYLASAKITGIGLIIIGVVGFIIFLIFQFLGIF
ncbi:MAG: protein translocase SEC61 complex subunit gamma [Candidatus Aenigmatarchaeota archaeon]|nr:MAG: protein translocase SEC61 complex subunit gamma [Candidatus Aenigmarchaeota archaeon]